MNAEKYFKAHPTVDEFYFTTNGLAFTSKDKAMAHQKSLTGKPGDVKTVKRDTVKPDPETKKKKEELEAQLKNFQNLLLDTQNAKEKAGIEENIKKLKNEIAKLK